MGVMTTKTPETFTTTDQNTRREITWNVDFVQEAGPNVEEQYGWTHFMGVSRPKGRRSYSVWVKVVDGKVARHSNPVVSF